MITNRVFTRTYWIKCGSSSGTGFLVDIDSKRYLVTVKHVVSEYSETNPICYAKNNTWHILPTIRTWIGDDSADLAIFSPQTPTRPNAPGWNIELNSASVQIGQDVFFTGFPYGMFTDNLGANDGFPIALVKKACFSGVDSRQNVYYLDGVVNKGFSGAPVIAKVSGEENEKIIGVIEGYYGKVNPVTENGQETGLEVEYNPGIIKSLNIKLVTDAISNNPNGFQLPW